MLLSSDYYKRKGVDKKKKEKFQIYFSIYFFWPCVVVVILRAGWAGEKTLKIETHAQDLIYSKLNGIHVYV